MKKAMILIALIMMIQSVDAIGIGISPSELVFNNSLKGATYENSLTIINMDKEDMNYALSSSGDIEGWVRFYHPDPDTEIKTVKVPGNGKTSIILKFQIPPDAMSKNYIGDIVVRSVPEKSEVSGSQQSLIVGGSSKVTIIVTGDQIIDGVVNGISTNDVEPGYPLKIETMFRNTGNVVAIPEIKVTILQDGNIINNFIYNKTKIKPSITDAIIAEWNTTEKNIPGDYTANVIVSLDGKILRSDDLSFKILPVGTLTRQGNLTKIVIEGKPAVNIVSKVYAFFENTGEIDTMAKFKGELYKDGNLIDTIESDELTVQKKKNIELTFYIKPISPGDYTIKGAVVYSGKKTEIKELSFKVSDNKSTPGFEVISAALMILALMFVNRKKDKK